jgi:hypothetical protein
MERIVPLPYLTSWSSTLLDKEIVAQTIKKLRFMEPKVLLTSSQGTVAEQYV